MKRQFLFISSAPFEGGAEKSLLTYLSDTSVKDQLLVVHSNTVLSTDIQEAFRVYRLPFAWLVKTRNPITLIYFIVNWLYCSFRIYKIARKHEVSSIFANTYKTFLFTLFAKIFIRLKLIVCLRDNIGALWQKKVLTMSDQVIAISAHIQEQVDSNHPTEIIHPCVRKNEKIRESSLIKAQEQNRLIVATIGQLAPWKEQLLFLKLAETFKSNDFVRFQIIGDDQSKINKSYRNLVFQQAEALKNVEFLGYKPNLQEAMARIDVLVHFAKKEPFGRVIVEAMQSGKTVIALNSGGIPEIIENGKSGLLVDENLALFQSRKALSQLLESPERRLKMGKEAQKRAQQFTDINKHTQQVNDLLGVVHVG